MEGKILYGKIASPKFIAEASLADSFSFDLQRFDGDYVWSIGGGSSGDWLVNYSGKYIYGAGTTSIASLQLNSSTWSLAGGSNDTPIVLNFNDTASNSATAGQSITGGNILSSVNATTTPNIFDASSATGVFHFKLKNDANINLTSIAGGSAGNSLDASGVTSPSNGLWLVGGSGVDSIIAGNKGTFYLNGGGGSDSLVGGTGSGGQDYFIYGGSGSDSITNYNTGRDFISLTGGVGLPGVASVGTDSNNNHLVLNFGSNNSLTFADNNSTSSTYSVLFDNATYSFNKDYIQLGNNVSLTPDVKGYEATATGSIDASAVTNSGGVSITAYKDGSTIIGSATEATTIFSGAGTDFVSLGGASADIFVYNGGKDTVQNIATSGSVSLGAGKYSLITDGTALTSLENNSGFQLKFDNNNILTFLDPKGAVSIKGYSSTGNSSEHFVYTPTAISLAGATGVGDSVTLGSSYNTNNFTTDTFSLIDASAVTVPANEYFAVSGSLSGANYIVGSDNVFTSIMGGSGADTLIAGTAGASLVGNGGDDLLIGDSAKSTEVADYFIYNAGGHPTIRNYTYGTDTVVAQGDAVPTTNINGISLESGNSTFHISLGANAGTDSVLTFESATNVNIVSLGSDVKDTLFHYEADRIIVNNNRITLGSAYKSNFNANARTFTNNDYALSSIDASHVTVANGINVTGYADEANSIVSAMYGGKIIGGDKDDTLTAATSKNGDSLSSLTVDGGAYGNDVLIGGASSKDWFIYQGGTDSIGGYSSGQDTIQVIGFDMIRDGVTFDSIGTDHNLVLNFGGSDSLTVAGGASSNTTVAIKNGSHTFTYNAGEIVLDDKSVTLTSDYTVPSTAYTLDASVTAIDASAVSIGSGTLSIKGNDLGNRIIGSTTLANSLVGGSKNDYLSGGNKADYFVYTGGKDTVSGYQYSVTSGGSAITDSLIAEGNFVDNIKSGKVSGTRLIFTGGNNNKGDVLTFLSDDDAVEKVSLGGGNGYLTKDGRVSGNGETFKLFSNAKGEIDLTAAPYSVAGAAIESVNASAITAQSVTLVAGSLNADNATYILPTNKKRDRFIYAGGHVSISSYDSGKDQLNLGSGSINGFSISGNDVLISVSGYTGGTATDIISIASGKGNDFLIHQGTDKNANTYRKMALTQPGILTNKANKPTTVTVLAGAASLDASSNDLGGGTIKKIYAAAGLSGISIQAGDKYNTTIDMSAAGSGVSIYGGKRNDKITGSTTAGDLFVYRTDSGGTGGKDVITNFTSGSSGDKISLGAGVNFSSAKISTTGKSKNLTFKFNNKNSLALKSDSTISAVTAAGDTDTIYMFAKNAFSQSSGPVSLTSAFSGTFNTNSTFGSPVTNVDGHLVSKSLTFKGTTSNETLMGGTKKTTFKGSGGTDSLVGGAGKDVFFYAKNESGTATIADFDFSNDKLKIASGTLSTITTINGGGVQFAMKNTSGANVGFFDVKSSATYTKSGNEYEKKTAGTTAPGANTVIKANNTYYWFAPKTATGVTVGSGKDTVDITKGQLVTYNSKVSSGQIGKDVGVIELNYSTNLVKSGVAVAISDASKDKVAIPTGKQ